MTNYKEEMEKYSGEQNYRKPPRLDYPEIRLNGEEGHFVVVTRDNDGNYNSVPMDKDKIPTGVILRVRRRLNDFRNKLSTAEHNTAHDQVTMFGPNGLKERASAKELREKYQGLKTQQIVYVLTEKGDVVKLIARGASLGSENKPKDSIPFYEYLSSYQGDDHVWMYKTKFVPKEESGKLGKYYAISFEQGDKLSDEELKNVVENTKKISEIIEQQDNYYASFNKNSDSGAKTPPKNGDLPEVDIESSSEEIDSNTANFGEEIDTENLPF